MELHSHSATPDIRNFFIKPRAGLKGGAILTRIYLIQSDVAMCVKGVDRISDISLRRQHCIGCSVVTEKLSCDVGLCVFV